MAAPGPCPVCSTVNNVRIRYRDADLVAYRCPVCSAVLLDAGTPEAAYDESYFELPIFRNYRADYDPEKHPIPLYRSVLAAIKARVPPGGRLLEVGCGLGLFLHVAASEGFRATGVDPAACACEYARTRLGVDARTGFVHTAGFAPGSFDAAVLNDVIEHIADPYSLLRQVHPLLRPGGFLVLETPNEDALINQVSWWLWRASLGRLRAPFRANHAAEHRVYYNAASMSYLLQRCGFAAVEIRQTAIDPAARGCGKLLTWGGRMVFALARLLKAEHKMIVVARKANT
jgi:2-polyprenyl-3-methyl-5-hydroxy-6-metoxy-1,4-benzoquinol methylase